MTDLDTSAISRADGAPAEQTNELELPTSVVSSSSRRRLYLPGRDEQTGELIYNEFDIIDDDGATHTGVFAAEAVRVIRVTARPQWSQTRKALMIVVTQSMVVDGLFVGIKLDDHHVAPHPMLSDPRYARWARDVSRPKRIQAQQWVTAENFTLVMAYANALRDHHDFRLIKNPTNREGSARQTTDIFAASPATPSRGDRLHEYGVKLDAFEVTTNPNYQEGFKDFYTGLTEQQQRWENAFTLEGEERKLELQQVARNIHFISGLYRQDGAREWWARPVDVSSVRIGGETYALYNRNQDRLTEDDFALLFANDGGSDPAAERISEEVRSIQEALTLEAGEGF